MTTLTLRLSDGTAQEWVPSSYTVLHPRLVRVRHCYEMEWLIVRDNRIRSYQGIDAVTRGELAAQNDDGSSKYSQSALHVNGLPSGLRMRETPYTENYWGLGWYDLQKNVFRMQHPDWSEQMLDQAMESTFQPYRFLNNKKPNTQDAILFDGATPRLTGGTEDRYGLAWVEIETFVGNSRAPSIEKFNPDLTPWMFQRAIVSRREGWISGFNWSNHRIVEQWSQLDWYEMFICVLSPTGTNWVPAPTGQSTSRTAFVEEHEPIPVPYHR